MAIFAGLVAFRQFLAISCEISRKTDLDSRIHYCSSLALCTFVVDGVCLFPRHWRICEKLHKTPFMTAPVVEDNKTFTKMARFLAERALLSRDWHDPPWKITLFSRDWHDLSQKMMVFS